MISLLKKSIDFVVFGNFIIALSAFFWAAETLSSFDPHFSNIHLCLFMFFGTAATYTFQRLSGPKPKKIQDPSQRQQWHLEHLSYQKISFIICLTLSFYFLSEASLNTIIYLIPAGLLSALYSLPLLFKRGLRNIAYLKIIVISIVWAYSSTIMIKGLSGHTIDQADLWNLLRNFLFTFSITIPFDIRDEDRDRGEINTLVHQLGVENSKVFSIVLLLSYIVIGWVLHGNTLYSMTELAFGVLLILMIQQSSKDQNDYFYLVGFDGSMIIKSLLSISLLHQ